MFAAKGNWYENSNNQETVVQTPTCIGMLLLLAGAVTALAWAAAGASISSVDIGGIVHGAHGPEAGVWGIAETTDLPTKYAKIVVTDDR